jgi:uncharacterized protein
MGVDFERIGDDVEKWVHFIENRAYMKMLDGHCSALTYDAAHGLFLCAIYERRPDVCRWLERGSGHCAGDRAEKSAESLVMLKRNPRQCDSQVE